MNYGFLIRGFIGVLLTFAISCGPPRESENVVPITPELFEQLTKSEVFYGNFGSGRIRDVAELGSAEPDIAIDQVTFDHSLGYITISGRVVDRATREPMPAADVVIGDVEYRNDRPVRIRSKRWVISGANGEFFIDSYIESCDRLYITALGYIVQVHDISRLLDLK